MNEVILSGRLVRDPEIRHNVGETRYSIANYTLAVRRPFAKEGQQEADFIRVKAFGPNCSFADNYLAKGIKVEVWGQLQSRSYAGRGRQARLCHGSAGRRPGIRRNFDNIISVVRSRNIHVSLIIQSIAQLETLYHKRAMTIADNCDTTLYLGGNNPETARFIAERANMMPWTVLSMRIDDALLLQRGAAPRKVQRIRLEEAPEPMRMLQAGKRKTLLRYENVL